jgi:hypothetical protein
MILRGYATLVNNINCDYIRELCMVPPGRMGNNPNVNSCIKAALFSYEETETNPPTLNCMSSQEDK